MGVAGVATAAYLASDSSNRLVKANSGSFPDALSNQPAKLVLRPSWETKFEAPASNSLKDDLDMAAKSRLIRRPSWAAKFEGHEAEAPRGMLRAASARDALVATIAAPPPFDPNVASLMSPEEVRCARLTSTLLCILLLCECTHHALVVFLCRRTGSFVLLGAVDDKPSALACRCRHLRTQRHQQRESAHMHVIRHGRFMPTCKAARYKCACMAARYHTGPDHGQNDETMKP